MDFIMDNYEIGAVEAKAALLTALSLQFIYFLISDKQVN